MRVILIGTMIILLTTFSSAEELHYSAPIMQKKADSKNTGAYVRSKHRLYGLSH
jgi:hypothetical protein